MPQLSLFGVLGISVLVLGAGSALAVGALNAAGGEDACEPSFASGSASELVSAISSQAGMPDVSFPTPLVSPGRQISILQEGAGEPVRSGGYVDFDVSIYVGNSGAYLDGSRYDPGNPVRRAVGPDTQDFFGTTLECQKPGSRIAVTTQVLDMFGPIPEDDVLQNTSTLVAVIDVYHVYPGLADGASRLPQSGLPTITQAPRGEHGFSFPNSPIPEELRVSVLKKGSGAVIARGDTVTAHFTGVVWNTRRVFGSSFEQGVPFRLLMEDSSSSATGEGILPGLALALIGQTVGSQVLISVPPELGYQPGAAPSAVPENSTLVFVFDILGVTR